LVNFRQRLLAGDLSTLGFSAVLEALIEAGLITRKNRQRLDSTQMLGRISRMSRLDCMRESLRLALEEIAEQLPADQKPPEWPHWRERYVETQTDYRASQETLARKLIEAGTDAQQVLDWLTDESGKPWAAGQQVKLLARVFGEQFELADDQRVWKSALSQSWKVAVRVGISLKSSSVNPATAGTRRRALFYWRRWRRGLRRRA
jgi:hypothetical protein